MASHGLGRVFSNLTTVGTLTARARISEVQKSPISIARTWGDHACASLAHHQNLRHLGFRRFLDRNSSRSQKRRDTKRESAELGLENKRLKRGSCRQKRVPFSPFLSRCRVMNESSKRSLPSGPEAEQYGRPGRITVRGELQQKPPAKAPWSRDGGSVLFNLLGYIHLAGLCLAQDTLAWSSVHDQDRRRCSSAQPYISS